MALTASTSTLLTHPISFPKGQLCLRSHVQIHARNYPTSVSCSIKLPTMDQFHDPSSFKMQLNHVKGKILEVIPDSVKKFPWKKAENVALQQLLIFGQEVLKCSLFAVLIFGFVSDVMYSISKNKELVVPFGLLVGCIIADFFKETSQEFFDISKIKSMMGYLLGIGCLFVLLKSVSVYFPVGGRIFISNVANGGLMQVLWYLKSSQETVRENAIEDAPVTRNAED